MEVKACFIKDTDIISFQQEDMMEYVRLCYEFPLIFFEKDHAIVFYSVEIVLEPKEFQFLYTLVLNRTKKKISKKPFGLSPKSLCNKILVKPRKINNIEKDYYLRRITKFKSDIFQKIKEQFLRNANSKQKCYKNPVELDNITPEQKVLKGLPVSTYSPYYSFDLLTDINNLIYSERTKNAIKICTNFFFSADINRQQNKQINKQM